MIYVNRNNELFYMREGNVIFCKREGESWRKSNFSVDQFLREVSKGTFQPEYFSLEK